MDSIDYYTSKIEKLSKEVSIYSSFYYDQYKFALLPSGKYVNNEAAASCIIET